MRIRSKIFIVGAIPIGIAAGIGVIALLLLNEANRARSGAVMAGTVYRTLLTAVMARNNYVQAQPDTRILYHHLFIDVTAQAREQLAALREMDRGEASATAAAEATLTQYTETMKRLVRVTSDNDRLMEEMRSRAATLIRLTDQGRERQHASNADIVRSLTEGDAKLRTARDIVDAAFSTRIAIAAVQTEALTIGEAADPDRTAEARRLLTFDVVRLKQATAHLVDLIGAKSNAQSEDMAPAGAELLQRIERLTAHLDGATRLPDPGDRKTVADLAIWSEQLLKIFSAEYRSFHEEAAQLLTYSVQAHETELATQNIAIETLKLSNVAAWALSRRDEAAAAGILSKSAGLTDTIAGLPISPLIQSEMIDAFRRWHDGLETSTAGIREQNTLVGDMDGAATAMIEAARSLDAVFSGNAERNARSIQVILVLGVAVGLLLGGAAAFLVARSFARPLADLQSRIVRMARDPDSGLIRDDGRRDELGDIARATNVFLVEIARRERALRKAKERADAALETLRRTQAELIQAEKLASLGQLVAGVAHEINTPIGIALTTSTTVEEEAQHFRAVTRDGRISRGALDRLVDRVSEGASLLTANLGRAADLIQSFKHVAADQVSGERRVFEVRTFLHQLLTSLGPMLRKSGHVATMDCPDDLTLDSYPGVLGQVITNLVVNASLHGYVPGQAGAIHVSVSAGDDGLRLSVSDDGRGIAPEHRAKIFDPFFTTRRAQGSTGLGLHIVFNLVTSTLHGRIDLDREVRRGTRFVIDLPRLPAPHEKAASPSEAMA